MDNFVNVRGSALQALETSQKKKSECTESLKKAKNDFEIRSKEVVTQKSTIDMLERKLSQLQLKKITHEDLLEVELERLNRLK